MVWGVNDWGITANRPAGTILKDNVMHSLMVREGEDYVLKITVPDSSTIDYIFQFTKKAGPFKIKFDYIDFNQQPAKKFYHNIVNGNAVIRINPDLNKLKPVKSIGLLKYSALFFFTFSALAILLWACKKVVFKTAFVPLNPTVLFFAISIALLVTLVIIRAIITNEAVQFLYAPFHALPLLFKTSFQDLLYTCILTSLFGFFFFIRKTGRALILWLFGSFAILSIIICTANIQITALLGRPLNYEWLYYSDFLMSKDASRAIRTNIEKRALFSYLLMILAAIPLVFLIYHLLLKKPVIVFTIFTVCLVISYFAKNDLSINNGNRENPVIYFLTSLSRQNGLSKLSNKKGIDIREFTGENKNVLQPQYALKFKKANIKNVIIFVLESTPAEYITPYNSIYQTTPFLDSIKSSTVFFDAAYAHVPATNKSLVSILCGNYPYLSYKSITAEKPAIGWPSISSELKKNGYRTSFFNSGDNRFQGADSFLQHRGLNEIQDFRQNTCGMPVFSDPRYTNENLEGINDACLPVKFFNWIKEDRSTPFFSMMWTYQTHYPYYTASNRINFHSNNESLEKYLNALHDADKTLRQLVEGLKKRGLINSTLIVILGDHGEAFGRHGQITHAGGIYEENVHIPLILFNPQLFNGEHINAVAGISDIAPTIFSILNKPIPHQWQGEDLFSISRRNKVYFFSPFSDLVFGCREGNYKLIYNATTDISYLYDLKTDPHESVNVADKNPKYVKELSENLNAWIQYQVHYVNSFLK
jgi:phosphoglycerol transferase MdoB-like AlkP superfamily enzyme